MSDRSLRSSERDLLLALRDGPLDIHQLSADLSAAPSAVTTALGSLLRSGLVDTVVLECDRHAWELTERGRAQLDL